MAPEKKPMTNFVEVTELAGDEVAGEQVDRVHTRYAWALGHSMGKDVLEVACGTGPGLGLLKSSARSLVAGEILSPGEVVVVDGV